MKKMILFAIATVMVTMFSLTSATAQRTSSSLAEQNMYKHMGVDVCECNTPVFKVLIQLKTTDINSREYEKLLEILADETAKMEDCMRTVEKEYPEIDFNSPHDQAMKEAIWDNCPIMREL